MDTVMRIGPRWNFPLKVKPYLCHLHARSIFHPLLQLILWDVFPHHADRDFSQLVQILITSQIVGMLIMGKNSPSSAPASPQGSLPAVCRVPPCPWGHQPASGDAAYQLRGGPIQMLHPDTI